MSGSDHALRILHLPDVVGGHPSALSQGERSLGAASQTLSYLRSPYGYQADRTLSRQSGGLLARWAERLAVFHDIRGKFDVFHFNFGKSLLTSANGLLNLADLPFYPARALKVMSFQGSDARLHYEPVLLESLAAEQALGNAPPHEVWSTQALAAAALSRRRVIEKAARHCDWLYALNPDLLEGLPEGQSGFFPYAIAPPQTESSHDKGDPDRPLHVVHLSTNRILKGTGLIEAALEKARQAHGITYEIIVGQPRASALQAMANADVFVDQMVLGWYGAAAVEACYLGKPVITWISDRQAEAAPIDLVQALPFVRARSDQIGDALRQLGRDRSALAEIGRKGREFAVKMHDPNLVAARSLAEYDVHRRLYRDSSTEIPS